MYIAERKCLEFREVLADQVNLGFSEVAMLLKHLINIQSAQNERLNTQNERLNTIEEPSERRHQELLAALKALKSV